MFIRCAGMLAGLSMLVSPALAADPAPIKQQAMTAHYRLELMIGPMEKVVMAADVKAGTVKDGEVMLKGNMATPKDAANARHIELHVVALDKGTNVPDATVAITLTDAANKAITLPIAVMYDAATGPSDTHYGNNAALPPGNYRIDVTANGEKSTFSIAIPAS
jgi:hypothetical protein